MDNYEYEDDSDEHYEAGEGLSAASEDSFDDSDEADENSDYVSEYVGIHRIMLLLIIVLVIGIVLLGLFIATRSAAVPVPTLKPPWLV